jgi:hypothetical protein
MELVAVLRTTIGTKESASSWLFRAQTDSTTMATTTV